MIAPPVVVTVPAKLGDVELCVRHEDWAVEVDIRPVGTSQVWTPIHVAGGRFVVRAR